MHDEGNQDKSDEHEQRNGDNGGSSSPRQHPVTIDYADLYDRLEAFLERMNVPMSDVDDIRQDVFLDIIGRGTLAQVGADLFAAYASRAGARAVYKWRRSVQRRLALQDRYAREKRSVEQQCAPDSEELYADREVMSFLRATVQRLPKKLRDVFVAREDELRSTAEVAELFQLPIGTVKSRLLQAWAIIAERAMCSGLAHAGVEVPERRKRRRARPKRRRGERRD